MRTLASLPLVLCGPLAPAAPAQQIAGYVFPPDGQAAIGYSCTGVGDVDGDGFVDFVLDGELPDESARIWVISGRNRQVIHTIEDPEVIVSLEYRYTFTGMGDVDGDGRDEFAAGVSLGGAEGAGRVTAYSGATGAPLFRLDGRRPGERFGGRLAGGVDMNGDGVPDLLVGVYSRQYTSDDGELMIGCGAVEVRSGRDGSLIREVSPRRRYAFFSTGLSILDDVDGDGVDEFVAGSYLEGYPGPRPGSISVVSGATGETLYEKRGRHHYSFFGDAVVAVGDIDGDGRSDFVVNAGQETAQGGTSPRGVAHLLSGADGRELFSALDSDDNNFSNCIAALGDVDGDGVADFALSNRAASHEGAAFAGRVRVFSGRDYHVLLDLHGPGPGAKLGHSMVGLGDVTGDGVGDFAVGVPGVSYGGQNGSGVVVIYRGGPCVAWPVCTSTPNSAGPGAFLSWQGSLSLAENDFTVTAVGAPPNALGLFLMGDLATDEPFGAGRLCVGSSRGRPTELLPWLVTSGAGTAARPVDLEEHAVLALRPERFQLLYRDLAANPPTFNTSDALELVTCP